MKIFISLFCLFSFALLVFAAWYDREPMDTVYGVFAFGIGFCFGGFWAMVMSREDKSKANDI